MRQNQVIGLVVLMALAVVLGSGLMVSAHCIWAETPLRVTVGETFALWAFYAHPDDPMDEREVTGLALWVHSPNGDQEAVTLTPRGTFEKADITLTVAGEHTLVLERTPSRYWLQEIRDFGKSTVLVGDAERIPGHVVNLPLEVVYLESAQDGDRVTRVFQVLYDGEALSGAEVEVFQSLEATENLYEVVDEVETDASGRVSLVMDPIHAYVLETSHSVPSREVDGTGLFITQVRFRSTLFLGASY